NVELKVRDPDPEATLARALSLPGVRDEGEIHQRDTYFATSGGRLKLREESDARGARAHLISYTRADEATARTSAYRLLAAADAAMRNAYAAYSDFKVGAALRTPDGTVIVGANVENAAYPQGQCAEASAIGALVAAGQREISAVAVVAEKLEVCPPCGGC